MAADASVDAARVVRLSGPPVTVGAARMAVGSRLAGAPSTDAATLMDATFDLVAPQSGRATRLLRGTRSSSPGLAWADDCVIRLG